MSAAKKITEKRGLKTEVKLKVIRGGMYPFTKRELAVENFWLVCKATFWNTQDFSSEQETEFKTLIAEHFKTSRNLDKTFKELVERVCLAKRYVTRKKGRYISKPVDWLNINYKNGLANTSKWYKAVEEQRQLVPHYNEGIQVFAKAVQNYCDKKDTTDIINYRKELIALKQQDLVQLYMNTIMHVQYFNN